jgi:hypothetical protein
MRQVVACSIFFLKIRSSSIDHYAKKSCSLFLDLILFGVSVYFLEQYGSRLNDSKVTEQQESEQPVTPALDIGKFLIANFVGPFSILLLHWS